MSNLFVFNSLFYINQQTEKKIAERSNVRLALIERARRRKNPHRLETFERVAYPCKLFGDAQPGSREECARQLLRTDRDAHYAERIPYQRERLAGLQAALDEINADIEGIKTQLLRKE